MTKIFNDTFLRACRGEAVSHTPVWLMRQAGRYLPEYRAIRSTSRMLELCQNPSGVCEVTLQPLRRYELDAAILFSDITIPFLALNVDFDLAPGVGPVIRSPLRTMEDVRDLHYPSLGERLSFITESIHLLQRELAVPLIGFAGAPFTLAAYLIEGKPSRDFRLVRRLMFSAPEFWDQLMRLLVDITADYLLLQVEAGVQALQIFDSWIGGLSPSAYRRFIKPHMARLQDRLAGIAVPIIHFGTGTAMLLEDMHATLGTVMGVDAVTPLSFARKVLGDGVVLQGNLDPSTLFAPATYIEQEVRDILAQMSDRNGHIFNLGHGILPDTPPDAVRLLVDTVHQVSSR